MIHRLLSLLRSDRLDRTFVIRTTLFTSIPSQTAAPNYTTTWFVATTTIANYTVTGTASASAVVSAYNDLLVYCPITYNDTMSGWSAYDLPDDCLDGLLEYCSPSINATMPASTSFPASCSPAYWDAQLTASSTAALTPSTSSASVPEQTGIPTNCEFLSFIYNYYEEVCCVLNLPHYDHRRRILCGAS